MKEDNGNYKKIVFSKPFDVVSISTLPKEFEEMITFKDISGLNLSKRKRTTFDIMDTKYRSDYDTAMLSYVISAGIAEKQSRVYLVGETLDSYFKLNLNSGELSYFKSEEEYVNFLCEIRYDVDIMRLGPWYKTQKDLRGLTRIEVTK